MVVFLTQKQIISNTNLSERTVRNILKKLVVNGIVAELNNVSDFRFKKYKLTEVNNGT